MVAAVELARSGSPEEMVASLGWLALDHDQAGHLLVQANCVVRKLLLDYRNVSDLLNVRTTFP